MRALRLYGVFLLNLLAVLARADAVDDHLLKFMAEKKVPGMQIGIYRDGKAVKTKGYGVTQPENGQAVDEKTLFNIGSVTKQFTSAAVMLLAEEGKLSVGDGVRKILPELPEAYGKITLAQLMSHTSGMGDYDTVPGFDFHGQPTEKEFLAMLAKARLSSPPGEKYAYSNIGYALLGVVIARASGMPYETFVTERIFKKLSMDATAFIQPGGWPAGAAAGFNLAGEKLSRGRTERAKLAAPSGAILTNVLDMGKWDAALRNGALLRKESLDQMWTPAPLAGGKTANYGFGWSISKSPNGTFVMHTGATVAGFRAAIVRQLDGPISAVAFANLGADLNLTKLVNEAVGLWMRENKK
jgi:CubicO group peptidase (beta-lactamase class C family)